MTNFPTSLDDDASLPRVDDNVVEIGGIAINATRSAIFSLEEEVGIGGKGSLASIADRLAISMNADGTIKPSALLGIGLIALPITNSEISPTAAIDESKLALTYSTGSLHTLYLNLSNAVDVLGGFLSLTGIKLQPHLDGTDDRHILSHIDVGAGVSLVKTSPATGTTSIGTSVVSRNTTNLKTIAEDISNDLVVHEKSDGSSGVTSLTGGTVPPTNFAHNASGVHVNTANFSSIPQSNTDVQKIVNYIDSSSLLLLGGRTQNLFGDGISRHSRSTPLLIDGYGTLLVPPTPVTAYWLNNPPGPTSSNPVDDIDNGDDVILFNPTVADSDGYIFDAHFALVKPGDLLTINYGTGIAYQFTIESVKAIVNVTTRTYAVRINGRNKTGSSSGYAQINRSLFNRDKQHALANIRVPNSFGEYETLMVASPRGAMTLSINFNPSQLSASHYKLYLCLFQNGDVSSIFTLPAVDVTGNKGITPGKYTLSGIVNSTNAAFRASGFNYRFLAFEHEGQFGIAMADHYNNSGFSIISGTVDTTGAYTTSSIAAFPQNVVDSYNSIDPLGFGVLGSNMASPPPAASYSTSVAAFISPTIMFTPLKRNFFYVDGTERDTLYSDPLAITNTVDVNGDGYFKATILPAPATKILSNRVEVVYQLTEDVSSSSLAIGKTIVVQPAIATTNPSFNLRDYGRFTIKNIAYFNCGSQDGYANITVYDGVHGAGSSPAPTTTSIPVNIYFTNDSVSFNAQNVADATSLGPFKRYFENYVDKNGHTFTHERARFLIAGNIGNINMYNVSPKLRGYTVGDYKEIRLTITAYTTDTGVYSGYLGNVSGSKVGPTTAGKKGEVIRFYDETNIDYIDFIIDLDTTVSTFGGTETLDIQLFKSLSLNQEEMLLSTCQMNDTTKSMTHLQDKREFGNISEEHLTKSALNFITSISRVMMHNRVLNGFAVTISGSNVLLTGGTALIDGKIVQINNSVTTIPILRDNITPSPPTNTINWLLCANTRGQIELIADSTGLTNKIFYVINPTIASPIQYAVRSATLANLQAIPLTDSVSNFNDVILLYKIAAVVTGSGVSWSFSSITPTQEFTIGSRI
jgi:hypothetical protein